jgi:hypothetical protein
MINHPCSLGKVVQQASIGMSRMILEVPNESLDDKYLGLPSNVGRSNGAFVYLKDRIWKKLLSWMEICLFGRGRDLYQIGGSSYPHIFHGLV